VEELNYVSEGMFPYAAHLQRQAICAMTVFWVEALQDMADTVKRQWQEYGREKRRERTAHRGDAVDLGSWSRGRVCWACDGKYILLISASSRLGLTWTGVNGLTNWFTHNLT